METSLNSFKKFSPIVKKAMKEMLSVYLKIRKEQNPSEKSFVGHWMMLFIVLLEK